MGGSIFPFAIFNLHFPPFQFTVYAKLILPLKTIVNLFSNLLDFPLQCLFLLIIYPSIALLYFISLFPHSIDVDSIL